MANASRATFTATVSAYYFAQALEREPLGVAICAPKRSKNWVEVSVLTKISTRAALSGADVEKEKRL